jgi:hypothetical protein
MSQATETAVTCEPSSYIKAPHLAGSFGQQHVALDALPQSWVCKCAGSTSVAEKGLVYLWSQYHKYHT